MPGGDMHEAHEEFIEWAGLYNTGGLDMRSAKLHREWFKLCTCPIIELDSAVSVDENLEEIEKDIQSFSKPGKVG